MSSPEHPLDSRTGLKAVNVICWGLLLMLAVIVGTLVWSHVKGGEGFDFVYFYGAGRLAAERPPTRLYDYTSQLQVFRSICPQQNEHYGPSPYPPFVALFFAMFARLPFPVAYFLWMAISLVLYVSGIWAILKEVFPDNASEAWLMLCLALAFPPFLLYNLVNGQLSSVAVCCIGLAIYGEGRQKQFTSGLLLSVLTYKPTLLLLILPMLFLTRRFRALAGFASGTAMLGAISTIFGGLQIWTAYARLIEAFRKLSSGDVSSGIKGGLRHWQFVDLNALSYAIPGARSQLGFAILAVLLAILATWGAVLFWKSALGGRSIQWLTWAVALTWTLLLNVYVPIYDSVLAATAIILTIGAVKELGWRDALRFTAIVGAGIFLVSWGTRAFAERHGIQLLTVLLVVFGTTQLWFLQNSIGLRPSEGRRSLPGGASVGHQVASLEH